MAVGARITSNNLSGKTATVTFVPYTGQTSGTTVNLGTKTIPFNNINTHPYGIYSLHFAEYDYTYTLTVSEPVINAQTFVFTDRMVGSDNFGAAFFNFSDLTAEIIDLGVDTSDWYNDNVYPLQNSGYMYHFGGDNNDNERLVIFTDASGLEIGRYSGTTNSWDSEALSGKIVSFEDGDNGVLTYSNGTSVFTYTWNPDTHYIDIENDWYTSTSDNTFIIKKYEEGSWDWNGNGQSYLVNGNDGTTTLLKTWTDGTSVRHKMQPNTDFIVVETQNQAMSGNTYTKLEICDTSGTTLETIWLTGSTYTSISDEFLGTNKYCAVYYDGDDNSVNYKIIHYNGDTETLTQTSHVRGANYTSINIQGDNDFYSNESGVNGGVAITLYYSTNYHTIGEEVSYCDIVYMLKNQTSFSTYVVANNTSVKVSTSGQLSNIYRTPISRGDFFEILTISSTGGTITTTSVPITGLTSVNNAWLGDKSIYNILSNDSYDIDSLLVNVNGSVMDTLSKTLNSSYAYSMNSVGQLGYLRLSIDGGNEAYYVYSGSTGFTSTSVYDDTRTPSSFYRDTFLDPEVMVLYSEGGGDDGFRVLTSTGITSELQFAPTNSREIRVGETKFMLVHNDNYTDAMIIAVYNFSGQLLNSYTTAYNGWSDTYGIGDRFVVVFNGDTGREYFLVSEETITSVVLDDHDSERAPNDYNWWND
jgi:hypothetical protein